MGDSTRSARWSFVLEAAAYCAMAGVLLYANTAESRDASWRATAGRVMVTLFAFLLATPAVLGGRRAAQSTIGVESCDDWTDLDKEPSQSSAAVWARWGKTMLRWALLMALAPLALHGWVLAGQLLDWRTPVAFALPISVAYSSVATAIDRGPIGLGLGFSRRMIASLVVSYSTLVCANFYFDEHPARAFQAKVLGVEASRHALTRLGVMHDLWGPYHEARSRRIHWLTRRDVNLSFLGPYQESQSDRVYWFTRHGVKLDGWGPYHEPQSHRIAKYLWSRLSAGDTVVTNVHPGEFGWAWVEVVDRKIDPTPSPDDEAPQFFLPEGDWLRCGDSTCAFVMDGIRLESNGDVTELGPRPSQRGVLDNYCTLGRGSHTWTRTSKSEVFVHFRPPPGAWCGAGIVWDDFRLQAKDPYRAIRGDGTHGWIYVVGDRARWSGDCRANGAPCTNDGQCSSASCKRGKCADGS